MIRRSRLLVLFMVITMVGLAWPGEVAAQQRAPAGRRVGTAVPRTYAGHRPVASPRFYGHYPRYYGYYY